MDETSEDSGPEWYEEPITIVGFVGGFLLLVLIIASLLILCYSNDEEQEDEDEQGQPRDGTNKREQAGTQMGRTVPDRTNPLYLSANEIDLQPYPPSLRANFVHIHTDENVPRESFQAYYNTK